MHPTLALFGHGSLPAYEVMLALGACVFVAVVAGSAARAGLPRERVFVWLVGTYLAAIAGARAAFAVSHAPAAGELLTVLWTARASGFSSLGGVALAVPVAWLLARGLGLPFSGLAGPAMIGGCALGALARVGCFLAGCCHGRPASLAWGLSFPAGSEAALRFGAGVPVHPTQLYEAALLGAIAGVLAVAGSRRRAVLSAAAYLVARFGLDFLRGDADRYAGLALSQWLAAAVLVTGASVLAARRSLGAPRNRRAAPGVSWMEAG